MRHCSLCTTDKEESEFTTADRYCRPCRKEYKRKRRAAGLERNYPTYQQPYMLKRRYGLSLSEYDNLVKSQGGVCAICGSPPSTRKLAVDHCHVNGHVRGALCLKCNTGLGSFGDDVERLERAICYLNVTVYAEK